MEKRPDFTDGQGPIGDVLRKIAIQVKLVKNGELYNFVTNKLYPRLHAEAEKGNFHFEVNSWDEGVDNQIVRTISEHPEFFVAYLRGQGISMQIEHRAVAWTRSSVTFKW